MRKALSKRTRFEVFKRDGFRCMYCGNRPPEVVLVIDHVVPVCEGGSDEVDNLVSSCYACNAGKSGVPLTDTPPAFDEMAVAEALQEVAERSLMLRKQVAALKAEKEQVGSTVDELFNCWFEIVGPERSVCFQDGSIATFLRLGLEVAQIHDAMQSAGRKLQQNYWMSDANLWKYLCGACWGTLRRTKEAA